MTGKLVGKSRQAGGPDGLLCTAFSCLHCAIWGLCFWKKPILGIQKMVSCVWEISCIWAEESLEVIFRRMQINSWVPEGDEED